MVCTIEQIEQMQANAEKARQAAKDGLRAYVSNSIVLLKDGERALVRPLYNMDAVIVRPMHDKFKNTDVSLSSRTVDGRAVAAPISALCAAHDGKPCLLCAQPKDAKLESRFECFVPVYLYGIKDMVNKAITYTDPDGNTKSVKGFRMLRCKQGSEILNQLMSTFKDADYGRDVTMCDFKLERHGAGMDTKYVCSPKPPKAMEANLKAAIPPIEKFVSILEEIYPVKILERAPVNGATAPTDGAAVSPTAKATEEEPEFTF